MELLQVEILTNRLLLQPISMKYRESIFREFTHEITTYMHPCAPKDIFETELFIKNSIAEIKSGDHLVIVILNITSQEFLGCTGIHKINSRQPELGIWLKKSAHGNGYGIETAAIASQEKSRLWGSWRG